MKNVNTLAKDKDIVKSKLAKLIFKNIVSPIAKGKKSDKNIYKNIYK